MSHLSFILALEGLSHRYLRVNGTNFDLNKELSFLFIFIRRNITLGLLEKPILYCFLLELKQAVILSFKVVQFLIKIRSFLFQN